MLPRGPNQQHIGIDRIAQQLGRQPLRINAAGTIAQHPGQAGQLLVAIKLPIRVAGKFRCGHHGGVADRNRTVQIKLADGFIASRHHQIAADQRRRLAGGNACGGHVIRGARNFDMRMHRAIFLRQPRDIQVRAEPAIGMGGHRQGLAHGHNPGTADPRYQHRK